MMCLVRAELERSRKKPQHEKKAEQSPGVYSAVDAAWWVSRAGRTNCVYMGGTQAGKTRDVDVTKVFAAIGGVIQLEVCDSAGDQIKTYFLDKVRNVKEVPLNADNFTAEDRKPELRFDDGNHMTMESSKLTLEVLREFVSKDPSYPFPSYMRPIIEDFLAKGAATSTAEENGPSGKAAYTRSLLEAATSAPAAFE